MQPLYCNSFTAWLEIFFRAFNLQLEMDDPIQVAYAKFVATLSLTLCARIVSILLKLDIGLTSKELLRFGYTAL